MGGEEARDDGRTGAGRARLSLLSGEGTPGWASVRECPLSDLPRLSAPQPATHRSFERLKKRVSAIVLGTVTRNRNVRPADIEAIYRDRFRVFVLSATAVLNDGEEALDVVQEGFARALRRRRSFRGEGSLEGWLWRIVLNLAADRR